MKKENIFRSLFVTIFIDYLSFGIIFPLLPYYVERYNSSPLMVGLVVASFSLMQFIFSPFWGRLSDKFGRKEIIIISLFGTSIGHLILALSGSMIWVLIARLITGLFTAASLPSTYALVSDITKEEERAEKFGMLGAAWGLGFIFGPAIGGYLSTINYSLPFYTASLIAFLNCFVVLWVVPDIHNLKNLNQIRQEGVYNFKLVIKQLFRSIGGYLILFFLVAFTLSGLEVSFPLYGKNRFGLNETNVGLIFTFIGLVIALTQGLLVGRLVKKLGEIRVIIVAQLAMVVGYAMLAFSFEIPTLLIAVGILALGLALNEPSLASMISKKSNEAYGTTLGFLWSVDSFARVLGPMFFGYLYIFSATAPFYFSSALIFVAMILTIGFVLKFITNLFQRNERELP